MKENKNMVKQNELTHILFMRTDSDCGFYDDSEELMTQLANEHEGWFDEFDITCHIVRSLSTQKHTIKLLERYLRGNRNMHSRKLVVYLPDLNLSFELFLQNNILMAEAFEYEDINKVLNNFWGYCPKDHSTLKHISRKYKKSNLKLN